MTTSPAVEPAYKKFALSCAMKAAPAFKVITSRHRSAMVGLEASLLRGKQPNGALPLNGWLLAKFGIGKHELPKFMAELGALGFVAQS